MDAVGPKFSFATSRDKSTSVSQTAQMIFRFVQRRTFDVPTVAVPGLPNPDSYFRFCGTFQSRMLMSMLDVITVCPSALSANPLIGPL